VQLSSPQRGARLGEDGVTTDITGERLDSRFDNAETQDDKLDQDIEDFLHEDEDCSGLFGDDAVGTPGLDECADDVRTPAADGCADDVRTPSDDLGRHDVPTEPTNRRANGSTRFALRITDEFRCRLDELAAREGRTPSALIRRLVTDEYRRVFGGLRQAPSPHTKQGPVAMPPSPWPGAFPLRLLPLPHPFPCRRQCQRELARACVSPASSARGARYELRVSAA